MKNNLPIDNPPKIRLQATAKRPVLPIHACKDRFQATIAGAHSHRSLLDAADDTQSRHLRLLTLDKNSRRLLKRSIVMVFPAK